ncbi:uncharacterized protein B0I36DRAFT_369321 [Microdochium trichocladiopsis]|uniref:Zn(2)-C6 fungal-type domain-containing protein n=1 Tax=Microdochium trichocladiopsis TaxID=1682393 RepID=A0A9P9BLR4_9PEZI|nr:uncharacterized protein B0I36DRAFT_369321 [Microdochium trichocladiopsis]KAH7014357.1 hypothetical protein B0I36DRAFT_369321 [Microdochium trichocladiopsis]
MVRKGSSKVRTGCLTCKSRKVKCDEAKPECQRCVRAGRACEGYAARHTGDPALIGWHRPRSLLASADDPAEARALQYYCTAAGPGMSGAIDPNFWSRLVYQFSSFEPAVRHSVVAISSLFEKLRRNPRGPMVVLEDSSLALNHYNAAIGQLRSSDNQPLIVLACVLFICIEVLQNNTAVAVQHCKHGIALLNDIAGRHGWIREYLIPIFRRMTLLPLLFGRFPDDFPLRLLPLEDPLPLSFAVLSDARDLLWDGMILSAHLVRLGEPYRQRVFASSPSSLASASSPPPPTTTRLSFSSTTSASESTPLPPALIPQQHQQEHQQKVPVPAHLLALQRQAHAFLDHWHALWHDLESRPRTAADHSNPARQLTRTMLRVRYEVCRIWAATAFDPAETAYDGYLDVFGRCIAQCSVFRTSLPPAWHAAKDHFKFMLEMGYAPILYFIAVKCRDLELRLQALQLMLFLSAPRESLWDVNLMYEKGLRIVEAEHGVVLDHEPRNSPAHPGPEVLRPALCPGLPPEEWRVGGYWADYTADEIVQPAMREVVGTIEEMTMLSDVVVAQGHGMRTDSQQQQLHGVRGAGSVSDGSSPLGSKGSPATTVSEGSIHHHAFVDAGRTTKLLALAPKPPNCGQVVPTRQQLEGIVDEVRALHDHVV